MVGSPPRMRGKLILIPCVQPRGRITPADAGKTRGYRPRRRPRQDHPRGCGENKHRKFAHVEQIGSPPRMRGKLPLARASAICQEDHPRGCGENPYTGTVLTGQLGSPPRMRGKRGHSDRPAQSRRITPADAGKTRDQNRIASVRKDHPRGCGENCKLRSLSMQSTGSPPRMRGKPAFDSVLVP